MVFYILLLEPADLATPLQDTFYYEIKEENKFEVEAILAQEGQQYLIKWKGYPEAENTWEPKMNFQNCQQLLRQWKKSRQGEGRFQQQILKTKPPIQEPSQ